MSINYSIVVPAYQEAANIKPLTTQIFAALTAKGMADETELIIVDDNSPDDTAKFCTELKADGYNVRAIVRTKERGLSSAVMHGFNESRGSVCWPTQPPLYPLPLRPSILKAVLSDKMVNGGRKDVPGEVFLALNRLHIPKKELQPKNNTFHNIQPHTVPSLHGRGSAAPPYLRTGYAEGTQHTGGQVCAWD